MYTHARPELIKAHQPLKSLPLFDLPLGGPRVHLTDQCTVCRGLVLRLKVMRGSAFAHIWCNEKGGPMDSRTNEAADSIDINLSYWDPSGPPENTLTQYSPVYYAISGADLWILHVCFVASISFRRRRNFHEKISSRTQKRRR